MTNKEFDFQFDILYNNTSSNQAPGLDLYEKSVYLTRAQEELIKDYFNPKSNAKAEGFDDSAKRQSDFSALIKSINVDQLDYYRTNIEGKIVYGEDFKSIDADYEASNNTGEEDEGSYYSHVRLADNVISGISDKRLPLLYKMPSDLFILLNEEVEEIEIGYDDQGEELYRWFNTYTVVPISYTEYSRLMSKPYKLPNKNQAWRISNTYLKNNAKVGNKYLEVVELIGNFVETGNPIYYIRYVKRPSPIILTDLTDYPDSPTIYGESKETECKLPDHLHEEILQRAVELAKITWTGDNNSTLEIGKRVE